MSNPDFFSLFPPEDSTSLANADELTELFDSNPPEDNGESAAAQLDNFAVMFDEILLDGETALGASGLGVEEAVDQGDPQADPPENAITAIATDLAWEETEWDDWENGLTTDLSAVVSNDDPDVDDQDLIDELSDELPDELSEAVVHSLTPPFLQSYQTLQTQVAQLTQQLATADQQAMAYQRRADSAETLIQQQAAELTQAQEQLSHTVAELQVYQEEAKRQQLQLETLAEQFAQSQAQLNELGDQFAHSQEQLAIAATEKQTLEVKISQYPAQVSGLEKHLDELRHRLQRQQRYALQYKSALEHCLAQPDFRPSSDISQVVARLTGQNPDLQPWASVGDILAAFPQSPETPLVGDRPAQAPTPATVPNPPEAKTPTDSPPPLPAKNPVRRPLDPDNLSFTAREPEKAPSRHVELPNFLPRAVSLSR